ncbi:MAG: hypothetical protein JST73_13505, partial [Actinobacteria bacterium]|nr:hypothetical protein [Actinomycetota bacterium]
MRHFRFAAVTAVLTVAGATVAGCSSSARTTTTTTHPATTPAPTTTLAPTTTAPIRATGSAALGTDAAAALVAAWQHNDRAQAATIADGIAVEGMWATPPGPIWLRGCTIDPSLPEGGCVYRT